MIDLKQDMNRVVGMAKNAALKPQDGMKAMGETSRFSSILVPETVVFALLVPVAYLIAWVLIGMGTPMGRMRMSLVMWVNASLLLVFYNLIHVFILTKAITFLKDTIGFTGSKEKINQLAVWTAFGYFVPAFLCIFLTFIGPTLAEHMRWIQPIISGGVVFYLMFMGFNNDYEADESKKIPFAGVIAGVATIVGLIINFIVFGFMKVALFV